MNVTDDMMNECSVQFTPYTTDSPLCAVTAITPPDQAHMHTYYDLCPWSPSERYVVSLMLPYEDRHPVPGDVATVCVIDLLARTIRRVGRTTGWGFQKGAHQQWGRTDRFLYFNDMRGGRPIGVRVDLDSDEKTEFDGPIWQISPDETFAISPCLIRANLTQPGYGVSVSPDQQLHNTARAAEDDGLFRVALKTGEQTLLVSLADIWQHLADGDDLPDGSILYAFHAKFNPRGTRILLVVRARTPDGSYRPQLVTFAPDGSDIRTVVSHHQWQRGAHHPMWHGDGEHILMCMVHDQSGYHFCLVHGTTGRITNLVDEPAGTGHPIVNRDGRLLVTDATYEETPKRRVAVRLIDVPDGTCRDICRVESPMAGGPLVALRRDAHITWDRRGRRLLFLGAPANKRQLFIADPVLPPRPEMKFDML